MLLSSVLTIQTAWSSLLWGPWGSDDRLANDVPSFKTVFEFSQPLSGENVAERSNGNILISTQGGPELFEIDPSHQQCGRSIHSFDQQEHLFGIAEVEPDVFYVLASNHTYAPTWTGVQGSNALYQVDLSGHDVVVSKVFDIDEALTLDGMITINTSKGLILAGDTQTGIIWLFDVHNRNYSAVYQSPLLNQTAKHYEVQLDRVGVNGIKYHNGNLYFTDTSRKSFGMIPFSQDTGRPLGEAIDIVHFKHHTDDFAISPNGIAILTLLEEGLVYFDLPSHRMRRKLPKLPHKFPGVNAVHFGTTKNSQCTLYVLYNLGVVSEDRSSGLTSLDIRGLGLKPGC